MLKSVVRMESVLKKIFLKSVDSVKMENIFEHQKPLRLKQSTQSGRLFVEVGSKEPIRVEITDKRCHIVGFGKAVYGMAAEVERILDQQLVSGILSVPVGTVDKFKHINMLKSSIEIFEGAENNLPDQEAFATAVKIRDFTTKLTDKDVLFVLISGGGSALLPLPASPVTLDEKMKLVQLLAKSGASINELNTVRIAISDIKGGKLAKAAKSASKIISLVISDIVGDPINLIASGPTYISNVNYQKAANEIIDKYKLEKELPGSLQTLLQDQSRVDQTLDLPNNHIFVIANNSIAVDAALKEAEANGFHAICLSKVLECDVEKLSQIYVELTMAIKTFLNTENKDDFLQSSRMTLENVTYEKDFPEELLKILNSKNKKGVCIVGAGETTVEVRGNGLGGRNQELTLHFIKKCLEADEKMKLGDISFLSAGTDGIDGPTSAAGSVGSLSTIRTLIDMSELNEILSTNDSFTFWHKKYPAGHIVTGHTGTNVMDIHLLLVPFS
ncbi:Glycerate kinase [Sergentomyia squamirostris]